MAVGGRSAPESMDTLVSQPRGKSGLVDTCKSTLHGVHARAPKTWCAGPNIRTLQGGCLVLENHGVRSLKHSFVDGEDTCAA